MFRSATGLGTWVAAVFLSCPPGFRQAGFRLFKPKQRRSKSMKSSNSRKRGGSTKKSTKTSKVTTRKIRTTLTDRQAARLIRISEEYTASVQRVVYPNPDLPSGLSAGIADAVDSLGITGVSPQFAKGKGKGKSGGGHSQPKATPQQVLQVVQTALSGLKPVGKEGNLVLGEFNVEFGDAGKAAYYAQAYTEILTRHHLMFISETDFNFLQVVGKANGYGYFCSTANNRGQAVGFLVHPRLRVIGKPIEYQQVGTVQGVPNLRPAYRLDLEDSTTGLKFSAVVVHLKSMRGGPAATAPVRYQQCQILQGLLGNDAVVSAGDWNTFLNNTKDTDPLTNNGHKLVNPGDSTSTQSMGGRLDGYFHANIAGVKLGRYQVRNFWKNKTIGRAFSDHGLVTCQMYLCGKQNPNQPDCSGAGGDSGPAEIDTQ
jgi:hypothetical protein